MRPESEVLTKEDILKAVKVLKENNCAGIKCPDCQQLAYVIVCKQKRFRCAMCGFEGKEELWQGK